MTGPTDPPTSSSVAASTIAGPLTADTLGSTVPHGPVTDLDGEAAIGYDQPRLGVRLLANCRTPPVLLAALSLASLVSRMAWIDHPSGFVFDETYYVTAARSILSKGIDPNSEHPPLAKLTIAGSMRIFGDSPLGWRFAPLVFGTAVVILMYWLVRSAKGSSWLALGASSLMAADNLFLIHGRIATLDIFVLAFMLAGVGLYLRDHPLLAGLVLGVGVCTKVVALYALLVIVIFELLYLSAARSRLLGGGRSDHQRRMTALATCTATTVVSGVGLLYVLDLAFTNFTNPFDHIRFMYAYGSSDKLFPIAPGVKFAPSSSAWQWLANRVPIPYFRSVVISGGHTGQPLLFFQGRMNPFIVYMTIPGVLLAVGAAWKRRDNVSFLIVAWFGGTFVPFIALSLQNHLSYIYYMLIVLPAVCLAAARLFSGRYLPRFVTAIYGALVVYDLWALYPIQSLTR